LRAEGIYLLSDVDSFHYRPLLPTPPEVVARELRDFGLVDAAVIAVPNEEEMVRKIAATKTANPNLPVWIGGYGSNENIVRLLSVADGAIVGGTFEAGGRNGPVVREKVEQFLKQVHQARSAPAD
jgi:predicted TIM-barrel enzyme